MRKSYNFLTTLLSIMVLFFSVNLFAQEIGEVIWEDHFDDPAQDFILNNVGWLYFGEDDGLVGQVTMQDGVGEEGRAFIKSGVFNIVIGAAVIETNGFSHVDPAEYDSTEARWNAQNANIDPNQNITFKVNFNKITNVPGGTYEAAGGTYFVCGTRMYNPRGYGDPIEDSTYVLFISPLTHTSMIAKFSGDLAILDPSSWTVMAQSTDFEYDLLVDYWVQFYLYEGDLKVKVWEGEFEDGDSEDWLMEATDPEPWVRGTWTEFGLIGDPVVDGTTPDGDEIYLDDIVVSRVSVTDIEPGITNAPNKFELQNNYPNPFNPTTTIKFSLEKAGLTTVNVYSLSGQLIRTLINENRSAGANEVKFDGKDSNGKRIASGVYFYQLSSNKQVETRKMIMLK